MYHNICRFDTITVYITSTNGTDGVFIGACVVGSDEASSEHKDPSMECILSEQCDVRHEMPAKDCCREVLCCIIAESDETLSVCSTLIVYCSYSDASRNILGEDRSRKLCSYCIEDHMR